MISVDERRISKFISLILRHKPEAIDIKLDEHGWAYIKELIDGINNNGEKISFEDLKYIVKNDDKQRYSFNSDYTKIRTNQGHSINVNVELKEAVPPQILYHGTAGSNVKDKIINHGIKPMSRLYVHLSENKNTAIKVGSRHGNDIAIFVIDTAKMIEDEFIFYISENGVWLTEEVPSKYITMIDPDTEVKIISCEKIKQIGEIEYDD